MLRMLKYICLITLVMAFFLAVSYAETDSIVREAPLGTGQRITPIVKVIREWAPSVVNISTERTVLLQTQPFWKDYGGILDKFQGQFSQQTIGALNLKSLGSGVIISDDGLILTNAHVVNMASKIYVTFYDGTRKEAAVAAVSQRDDLALIEVSLPPRIRPVKIANDVMIGETAIAIGNPLGLENSVTAGVVSGVNRELSDPTTGRVIFNGLIQTDTPVNPGSSGGALLNLDGELVGINLAVVQTAQSISLAISFARIKSMLKEYKQLKAKVEAQKLEGSYRSKSTRK
ncbi:MAG: hypothetical protein A3G36_03330 [Omnitrophica bacterium RIFCSPLOWO2_12_FULL_45_13]|nr:MAG: hypothetical protein A3G36_03330 [Omnitrophica bacterium RIFCSPLOWO2_12_FULL_45_13]